MRTVNTRPNVLDMFDRPLDKSKNYVIIVMEGKAMKPAESGPYHHSYPTFDG